MNDPDLFILKLAEGPLFRCAFALLVLGVLRTALLSLSDAVGGYLTARERAEFWHKVWQRLLWFIYPSLLLGRKGVGGGAATYAYHLGLSAVSLVFRLGMILVPAFMVAHVYLWQRGLGVSWAALPGPVADFLAVVTMAAGVILFFGRLYSPVLRRLDPAWTFLKPLALLVPFLTGFLAMHPTWSALDYHAVRFLHIVSASVVFILVPFARLLAPVHTPLTRVVPDAAWTTEDTAADRAPARDDSNLVVP